jgi:hypothetical protein
MSTNNGRFNNGRYNNGTSNTRKSNISDGAAIAISISVFFLVSVLILVGWCKKRRQYQSSIHYTSNQMPLNTISSNIPLSTLGQGGVPAVYVIPSNANQPFPGSTGNQTIPTSPYATSPNSNSPYSTSPYSTSPTFANPHSTKPHSTSPYSTGSTFASPYSPSQNSFLESGPDSNHGNIYTNQSLDNTSSNFIPGSTNQPGNSTIYSDQLPYYSENQGDKLPPYRDNLS